MPPASIPNYATWKNATHKNWWNDKGLRVCMFHCLTLCLGTFTIGYDGSYLNALQALDTWNNYFDHPTGNRLGLISACAYLPNIAVSPLVPLATDRFGRRVVIWISCLFLIGGAVISGAAKNEAMFIVGRVIVGGASSFVVNGTVLLLSEIAHPRFRGVITSFYLCVFFIGSIVASWIGFGCVYWNSNWAWRVVTLAQCLGPLVLLIATWFALPESPRWLVANGREAEARVILERLHANGSQDDELVINEMEEISAALKLDEDAKNVKWSSFFATKGNRKRFLVLSLIGTGSQMLGNNIISYYLAPVLRTVGITNSAQIAGINGGMSVFNFLMAVAGALAVDRLGRRPLWLISSVGCFISFVFITALAAAFAKSGSAAVGSAVVAFLFIFYANYAFGWTPLVFSYSVEILPYGLRAKGMCYMTFLQQLMQVFCQWANPIFLKDIGWKYYAVYIPIIAFYTTGAYFLFVETKGYTAEEVALVFDQDKNHVDIVEQLGTGEKSKHGEIDMIEDVDKQSA